jgi:hypothetical protein
MKSNKDKTQEIGRGTKVSGKFAIEPFKGGGKQPIRRGGIKRQDSGDKKVLELSEQLENVKTLLKQSEKMVVNKNNELHQKQQVLENEEKKTKEISVKLEEISVKLEEKAETIDKLNEINNELQLKFNKQIIVLEEEREKEKDLIREQEKDWQKALDNLKTNLENSELMKAQELFELNKELTELKQEKEISEERLLQLSSDAKLLKTQSQEKEKILNDKIKELDKKLEVSEAVVIQEKQNITFLRKETQDSKNKMETEREGFNKEIKILNENVTVSESAIKEYQSKVNDLTLKFQTSQDLVNVANEKLIAEMDNYTSIIDEKDLIQAQKEQVINELNKELKQADNKQKVLVKEVEGLRCNLAVLQETLDKKDETQQKAFLELKAQLDKSSLDGESKAKELEQVNNLLLTHKKLSEEISSKYQDLKQEYENEKVLHIQENQKFTQEILDLSSTLELLNTEVGLSGDIEINNNNIDQYQYD